jgi:uncharacterized protein YyaL (SSP411 family)
LEWALQMTQILQDLYKAEDGAFYQTDGEDKTLILRTCQFSDGAEPSGNAIHTENLLRLYQMTGDIKYLQQAEDVFKAVQEYLENYPPGYCYHVMNLQWYYDKKAPTIIAALNTKYNYEKELGQMINQNFIPHKTVIWQNQDVDLEELLPSIKEQEPIQDQTTLYICCQGACQSPMTDLNTMRVMLDKL